MSSLKLTKDSKIQISSSPYPYLSREHIASEMGFKFNDINEILSNDMGYGMSFPEYARLDRKAQAAAYDRHIYPLSGFTKGDEAKVTIIGKLRGYDPDFTSEQLSDLKNCINSSWRLPRYSFKNSFTVYGVSLKIFGLSLSGFAC